MGLSRACRDLFNSVSVCIKNEEIGKAKGLIDQAIALAPANKEIIARAVNQLVYAELYSSARKVFEDYQKQTGLKLTLNFTYEDVVKWEQDNLMIDDVPVFDLSVGPLRFEMMQDVERGGLSSFISTSIPIKEIEVSDQGFVVTQPGLIYAYKWNEVTRASMIMRTIYKGVGIYGTDLSQKIFTLETAEKRFQFDVSSTYPDFRGALLLRTIFARYLDVEIIDERKPGFKAPKDDPIRNLKWGDRIRQGMIWGAIVLSILFIYINASAPNSH